MSQTYASLTTQQQQQLQADMDIVFRPIAGQLCSLLNQLTSLSTIYNQNGTAAILALLTNTETIPNSSNLAGALPLTVFQWELFFNFLSNGTNGILLDTIFSPTMLGVLGQMAGPTNCVQGPASA